MANEVTITVTGRDQGAKATMAQAGQQASGLGKSVQRVGEIAQGIIAAQMFQQIGQAASQFLGRARDATSDLGESMNAVNVVFKGTAGGIHELGQTAASSMGLSQNAFNAAAVRFSAFAEAVAGPGGDVTKTIQDITQRSSDFASVMNLDVNEAMQLFQSGLAGESEPLRRYGIDVSAAAVETFAYANGIAEAGSALTEAEKVQARYGLIMQQTTQMSGDFANTSDSLANSQRILAAELENAQAVVGQLMVPGLEALNAVLIPLVQAFNDAPPAVQLVIGSLVLLGAGILSVTSRIAPMIIAMGAAGISMQGLAVKARTLTASLGPVGLIFAALAFAVVKGTQEFQAAQVDVQKLEEDLVRLATTGRETGLVSELMSRDLKNFGSTLEAVAANAESNWADRNFIWSPAKRKEVTQAVEDIAALDETLANIVSTGGDAEAVLLAYAESANLTAEQVEELRSRLPEYAEAQQRANEEVLDGTEAAEEAAAAAGEYAVAVKKMADGWHDAVGDIADANGALQDANADLREDEELTTEAFLEQFAKRVEIAQNHNANITEIQERASADVREQMLADAIDNPELAQVMVDATAEEWERMEGLYRDAVTEANEAANLALIENIPALQQIAEDSGKAAAKGLADKIREGKPLTVAEVNKIMDAAKDEVEGTELMAVIDSSLNEKSRAAAERRLAFLARGRTAVINAQIVAEHGVNAPQLRASGGIVGGLASGGISGAQGGGPRGGRVLVGEQGPELVDLAPGSFVHPAGETRAMMSGTTSLRADSVGGSGGMGQDRYLALLERGLVRLGEVTDDEWEELRRIGWQGRAGDRMEALYPPLDQAGREFVRLGEVTSEEWEALKAAGWRGKAGDKMEALYPPMDELARAFSDAASTLNTSRIGPKGQTGAYSRDEFTDREWQALMSGGVDAYVNLKRQQFAGDPRYGEDYFATERQRATGTLAGQRTWDFYTSGGQSFAKIFASGETIALGRMHEDEAFRHLKNIGKLDQGGWLPPGVSIVENATGQPERVLPPGAGSGAPQIDVRVFIGDRELVDMVRVEVEEHDRDLRRRVTAGRSIR